MSLTMLSPQSSSPPPCPLSVRGPPSIPHVQSPSPVFSFFQSPLCSQFSFSAVTALIQTHPDPLSRRSLPNPPCGVSSPRSLPSDPSPSAQQIFLEFRPMHVTPLLANASVVPVDLRKKPKPKASNSLALPMVHGICLCLLSSSHPSTRTQLQRNTLSPRPTRLVSPPSPCPADASSFSHLTSSKALSWEALLTPLRPLSWSRGCDLR